MCDLLNDTEFILLLSKEIAIDWKILGRKLSVNDNELNELSNNYGSDGISEQAYQMLLKWKNSSNGNLEKLKMALQELHKDSLVANIDFFLSQALGNYTFFNPLGGFLRKLYFANKLK